jgi:hypothetical protein
MASKTKKRAARKCATYTAQARALDKRIERAEDNNVLDMMLAEKRSLIQARALWDAIRVGVPDFITNALVSLIDAAAKSKGLPAPTYAEDKTETEAQAIEKIEHILCCAREYKPATPDIAQMIVNVWNHPDCPEVVADGINESTSHLFNELDEVYRTAPYVRALIEKHLQEKGAAS